jgi:hypothetical protein
VLGGEVLGLASIVLEIVELDEIIGGPDDQLIRPLDDAPLLLLVDHDRADRRTQRGRRIE